MEKLKNQLIQLINESKLPAEAVYFVVKDLYRDIYDELQIMKQQSQEKKEEE